MDLEEWDEKRMNSRVRLKKGDDLYDYDSYLDKKKDMVIQIKNKKSDSSFEINENEEDFSSDFGF